MKHRKVFVIGTIIALMLFSNLAFATELTATAPTDNWMGRIVSWINYNIFKKATTFSIYGTSLSCSQTPSQTNLMKNPEKVYWTNSQNYGAGSVFIAYFRGSPDNGKYVDHPSDSRQYLGEIYLEGTTAWKTEGSGSGAIVLNPQFTCDAGAYWNNDCYWEVYTCPKTTCVSNSECSGKFCDFSKSISSITGRGVCEVSSITISRVDIPAREDNIRVLNIVWNGGQSPYTLEVEWGDGDVFYQEGISSTSYSISHTYSAGTYNGAITVSDDNGGDSESLNIIISGVDGGNGGGTGGGIGVGNKQIGESCNNDIECQSYHCDKSHWYSLSQTCQPIPFSEIPKIALTKDKISTSTNDELLASSCLKDTECISKNYSVSCIKISSLRQDGTLTDLQSSSFFSRADSVLKGGATGGLIGGSIGVIACGISFGSAIGLILVPGVDALAIGTAITICGGAISGGITSGAILGASAGYIYTTDKDPLIKALKAKDANSVGICVLESSSSYCKYTSWAAFFPITKNKCTDGLIIIFGGLVLLILLLKR